MKAASCQTWGGGECLSFSPPTEGCPAGAGWFVSAGVDAVIIPFVPATTPSGFACHPSAGGESKEVRSYHIVKA
jgi:hypothetical protein